MIKEPWNKNKSVGQAKELTNEQIKLIRCKLSNLCKTKELALFNLGIATDLKANELLRLKVVDVKSSLVNYIMVRNLIVSADKKDGDYLFSNKNGGHYSRTYYARLVKRWVRMIGFESSGYSTRSITNKKED